MNSKYCGNENRLQAYTSMASGNSTGSGGGGCVMMALANFMMAARCTDGTMQPLKLVMVQLMPTVVWSVLSVSHVVCTVSEMEAWSTDVNFCPGMSDVLCGDSM